MSKSVLSPDPRGSCPSNTGDRVCVTRQHHTRTPPVINKVKGEEGSISKALFLSQNALRVGYMCWVSREFLFVTVLLLWAILFFFIVLYGNHQLWYLNNKQVGDVISNIHLQTQTHFFPDTPRIQPKNICYGNCRTTSGNTAFSPDRWLLYKTQRKKKTWGFLLFFCDYGYTFSSL